MMPPPCNPWDAAEPSSSSIRSRWHPDALPQDATAFPNYQYDMFSGAIAPTSSVPNGVLPLPQGGSIAWSQELGAPTPQSGPRQPPPPNRRLQDINIHPKTQSKSRSKRPVRRTLPWDGYKQMMHDHYMEENKTLKQLQKLMLEKYMFDATEKQYKDQFKQWGWRRYLGKGAGRIMKIKALKRQKQSPAKDTVFEWGGQVWTVDRVMKSCGNEVEDVEDDTYSDKTTPFGMTYHTPCNLVSPGVRVTSSTSPNWAQINASTSMGPTTQHRGIRLRWNGHTAADIHIIMDQAMELERLKDFDGADEKFTETLEACRNLLPPAHELTANTTYQAARFYARQSNMTRADTVLDDLTDQFVSQKGQKHDSTLNHYAKIGQLFEAWDRHQDSLNLIKRLTDDFKSAFPFDNDKSQDTQTAIHLDMQSLLAFSMLSTNRAETDLPSTQRILQMEVNNAAVIDLEGVDRPEQRVLNSLDQLMKSPERNLVDIVRAKHLLVMVYCKSIMPDDAREAFSQAKDSIMSLCRLECSKPKDFFVAATELAEYGLENGYADDPHKILEVVESEVVLAYGPDHCYTISLLIRIGKVVQEMDSWVEAQPYFEQAYAACITAFGLESLVTRRLEKALEEGRYPDGLDDNDSDKSIFQWISL